MDNEAYQKKEHARLKRRAILDYMHDHRNITTVEQFAWLFNIIDTEELATYKVEFNLQ